MMLKNLTLLIFLLSSGFATAQSQRYEARYDATDAGPILRHGDGPDNCDERGDLHVVERNAEAVAKRRDAAQFVAHRRLRSPIGADECGLVRRWQ